MSTAPGFCRKLGCDLPEQRNSGWCKHHQPSGGATFVWVVNDRGFDVAPVINCYVFSAIAPSGNGVIVVENGGTKWIPNARGRSFHYAAADAQDEAQIIVAACRKQAMKILARIDEAAKGVRVNQIRSDAWPKCESIKV